MMNDRNFPLTAIANGFARLNSVQESEIISTPIYYGHFTGFPLYIDASALSHSIVVKLRCFRFSKSVSSFYGSISA